MSIFRAARQRSFDLGGLFHNTARHHPDLVIHLDHRLRCSPSESRRITLREAADLVTHISIQLRRYGLEVQQKVMVWHEDGFDLPILASSIARAGAVPAMLSPYLPLDTALALYERLTPEIVITDAVRAAVLAEKLPAHAKVFATDENHGIAPVRDDQRRAQTTSDIAVAPHLPRPHDPLLITHTSGTTRLPKLAVHSARSLWYRVFPQEAVSIRLGKSAPGLMSVTMVHTRFVGALGMFFRRGKPLVIARDPDPEAIAQLLLQHRPDYIETHPNTFVDWEVLADDPRRPLSGIKFFHAAFDAIHPRTMRVLLDASDERRAKFYRFYGQSETGPATGQSYTQTSVRASAGQIVGRPIPALISVRITDEHGRPVRRGDTGHIWIASKSRIINYLGDEDAYTRNVHGRWWDTGDMGKVDRTGRLHLADREIDQMEGVPSGLLFEDLLMDRSPAIREAVVIRKDGEPVFLISTNPGHKLAVSDVHEIFSDIPEIAKVYVVDHDIFPFTATRKVQRPELTRRASDVAIFPRFVISTIDLKE